MSTNSINVYNLPVSGGSFPCQLGLLCELFDAVEGIETINASPDIVFAASGGNISTYIAMAGDWTSYGIYRVSRCIINEIFARSWFPKGLRLLPTGLLGIFKGSLYRDGFGSKLLLQRFLTNKSIQRVEVWTMTFNVKLFKSEIFCNKKKESCNIQPGDFSKELFTYDCIDFKYNDKKNIIDKIAKISMASASIPFLVEGQEINSTIHTDGGVMYPSPSLPLKEPLQKIINGYDNDLKHDEQIVDKNGELKITTKTKPKRLKYFYFEPYPLDSSYPLVNRSISAAYFEQLFHSRMLLDRRVGLDILKSMGTTTHTKYNNLNVKLLREIIVKLEDSGDHYFVSLSPNFIKTVSLIKVTGEDITSLISLTRSDYSANVWVCPQGN